MKIRPCVQCIGTGCTFTALFNKISVFLFLGKDRRSDGLRYPLALPAARKGARGSTGFAGFKVKTEGPGACMEASDPSA